MSLEAPRHIQDRINGRGQRSTFQMSSQFALVQKLFKAPKPTEGRINKRYEIMSQVSSNDEMILTQHPADKTSMRIRRRMRKDPQIALGLAAIKAPVMAAFESIKVDCLDPIVKGFVHHILVSEGLLRRAVYRALRSLDYGFIAHEKIWKNGVDVDFQIQDANGTAKNISLKRCTYLSDLEDLDPEWTRIAIKRNEYYGVYYGAMDTKIIPASKTWLVTHDMEFGHLMGTSIMETIYDPWYWCDILYMFTNRYFERKASPPIKGRAPTTITDTDTGEQKPGAEVFAQMLDTLISEGVIVLPSEDDGEGKSKTPIWDVEFLLDDARGDMFVSYIQHLQTIKLRGILVPEMVVEKGGSVGTHALAKAHTDTFVGMLTLILEEILQHINLYLIPEIISHNFPNPPKCTIDTLVRIGDRKDLLEQLLLQVIEAEAKVGSVDTARVIDIISLLRQLNINNVPGGRKMSDYDNQTELKDRTVSTQEQSAETLADQVETAAEIEEKKIASQEKIAKANAEAAKAAKAQAAKVQPSTTPKKDV